MGNKCSTKLCSGKLLYFRSEKNCIFKIDLDGSEKNDLNATTT